MYYQYIYSYEQQQGLQKWLIARDLDYATKYRYFYRHSSIPKDFSSHISTLDECALSCTKWPNYYVHLIWANFSRPFTFSILDISGKTPNLLMPSENLASKWGDWEDASRVGHDWGAAARLWMLESYIIVNWRENFNIAIHD